MRKFGSRGTMVAALGSTGAAHRPWRPGILFENVGASASIALIATGALVMLAVFGGYRLAGPRVAAVALAG